MRRVAVIGATGKVGRHAVQKALDAGFAVHALARHTENIGIEHEHLQAMQGDVRDIDSLVAAFQGVEMVLSCIGNRSKDKGLVIELGTRNIMTAMQADGVDVSRLALISSIGVGNSSRQLWRTGGRIFAFGLMFYTLMNDQRHDLIAAEKAAQESGLDVVLVRPTELTSAAGTGKWKVTDHLGKTGAKIPREDVGHFMVSLLDDRQYDGKAVTVGS